MAWQQAGSNPPWPLYYHKARLPRSPAPNLQSVEALLEHTAKSTKEQQEKEDERSSFTRVSYLLGARIARHTSSMFSPQTLLIGPNGDT
ncbi:hypothetical protein VNO77_19325 [Canavalia gladiata]|uniref:Uncharacterized protein n=1 Tax=Canavalia gladiata TaxID=3824 RepID=A0AAN9LR51_CANGL